MTRAAFGEYEKKKKKTVTQTTIVFSQCQERKKRKKSNHAAPQFLPHCSLGLEESIQKPHIIPHIQSHPYKSVHSL